MLSTDESDYKTYLSWERAYKPSSAENESSKGSRLIDPLDSDHLRILSSSSFRRLQDKTQLFPLEKNDYARTRLTHSCEVAATAKAIGECVIRLLNKRKKQKDGIGSLFQPFKRIDDVAYLSSLLHDIGNPPFGHYGEDVIRKYFEKNWDKLSYWHDGEEKQLALLFPVDGPEYCEFCGFDGNAQALRVVSKLERYGDDPYGLNLTLGVISGIIKYPYDAEYALKVLKKKKFGYFKSEEEVIEKLKEKRLFFFGNRCAVAYLVEAADDISMTISDFEDGIKKGCIRLRDVSMYRKHRGEKVTRFRDEFKRYYDENSKNQSEEPMIATAIRMLNSLRNSLIVDVAKAFVDLLEEWQAPFPQQLNSKRQKIQPLIEKSDHYPVVRMLKEIVEDNVYQDIQIVAPELKGENILYTLIDKMIHSVLFLSVEDLQSSNAKKPESKIAKLISKNYIDGFMKENADSHIFGDDKERREVYLKLRLVIDQVSGMTDSYAEQVYRNIT